MKTHKVIILITIVLMVAGFNSIQAQKMSDTERLALTVWVPDNEGEIPLAAIKVLENKLMQIATQNGITGSTDLLRFILTANIDVLTKDITPTAPVMQAFTLNVNLSIADGVDGKAFSSYSTTVKGVGENETKAYLSALKNLKANNPAYQSFIENGKSYTYAKAAIRISKYLDWPAKALYAFIIIPSFISQPLYKWFAKRRYKWFGKKETCMIPSSEVRARFLE